MTGASKPTAPATERNRDAILSVLKEEFAEVGSVLEIGSGTGQHAVYFANHLPQLSWQTSDREVNHDGISAWLADAGLDNVLQPLSMDVTEVDGVTESYDAVFSANTAHIMSFDAVASMFRLVGQVLSAGGVFCLYGPFKLDGNFTSDSNRNFDASLKSQDENMGIRDLEDLQMLAAGQSMSEKRRYAMPANNMLIVWSKDDV